jgi:hypothetical protein
MSGNTQQQTEEQTTKYTTSLTTEDEGVTAVGSEEEQADQQTEVAVAMGEETTPETESPSPEQNENATYEFGPMPNTFEMAVNATAWHPSWGPAPVGYENIVSRTQSTLSANTDMKVGETADGQPVKQGVRAIKKGNYTNTPDGMGATVGSGWTYHIPDWQLMERELAGDGVELSGSGVARLEAATAEKQAEAERRAQLPGREEVHEHYEPEDGESINEDSNVMTLWDEADEDTLTDIEGILGETGDEQVEAMSMMDAVEEVREYTMECTARRAQQSREEVAEANITNGMQPNFEFFNNSGNRTRVSKQATQRAPDHRPFDRDFMRPRPLGGFYPKWGSWSPETKEVEVPAGKKTYEGYKDTTTIEVAADPVAPIPDDHIEWAREQAEKYLMSRNLLDSIETGVMRLFDRNAEASGLSAEETYYADYSDELEAGEPHPASEDSGAFVARDGSIPHSAESTALGVPSVAHIREAYESALAHERDPIRAFEPAMEELWHGDATQSFAQIDGGWPGCTVMARVTKAYVPNHPDSQQQILYLEDVAPNVAEPGQMGGEVKLTVWRKSQIETMASVGDVLFISNPKPGEFRGDLTLAATGDTTIDRLVESDGPMMTFRDAWGKLTGQNDGKQRIASDDVAPGVGGTIEDDDVTRLPNKRYRRPGASLRRGPPEEDKNTRMSVPLAEQRPPMGWTHPIPEWAEDVYPEDTVGRDTVGERYSTTQEPSEILDDNSVDISPDDFALTLSHLEADLPRVSDEEIDPGADVTIHASPDDLGGIDEIVGVVGHHPHAPDDHEVRVFSGITLDPNEDNTTIRVVEWDTEKDEPVDFDSPVTHTHGWGKRMKAKVRSLRNRYFDEDMPSPVALANGGISTGATNGGVEVVDLDAAPSNHPEWQSRLVLRNADDDYECPVEGCEFTHPTKRASVVAHMGGKAQTCDDHAATLEEAAPEEGASEEESNSFVTGHTDDGTAIVDLNSA